MRKSFDNIYAYITKRTQEAEYQFHALGLMIMAGYLIFYLIWHDFNAQGYENLPIILIASLLGIPLFFKKHLSETALQFFPMYWYLTLLYLFPFFYSFMMLKNDFSTLWQLNSLVGLTIFVILIDWLSVILLTLIGVALGWVCYASTTTNPQIPLNTLESISICYICIIAFGGFFIHNKSRLQYERISAINNFTDMIAHEMRTPLVSINMTGANLKRWLAPLLQSYEIASQHKLDVPYIDKRILSKLPDNAASIEMESTQAQQIINMLLTNIEGRKTTKTRLETRQIVALINDALARYAFDLSDRKLIEFNPTSQDFEVKANDFFTNIIFNLIKNSLHQIKALNKGKITIWTAEGSEFNELHFKDTARGISKKRLAILFKPFVGDTRHGTGLGLAFCKIVMESYGGAICCESKEGEYAEFVLSFPKLKKS